MRQKTASRNQPHLKIVWRFNTDLSSCFFEILLGQKSTARFSSPDLKHSRQLTAQEASRTEELVRKIAPRIPHRSGSSVHIDPEIESELQISGDGWLFRYRWTNGQAASALTDFDPLVELGDYILEVLPVENLGFQFPEYL